MANVSFPLPKQVVNPALGTDLSGVADLTPHMGESSGRQCLAESLARRLITPRGSLFYDLLYGYDVTGQINADILASDIPRIAASIEEEFRKDERVIDATVTAQFVGRDQVDAARAGIVANPNPGTQGVLVITSVVKDGQGPFTLTLAATAVTIQILGVTS